MCAASSPFCSAVASSEPVLLADVLPEIEAQLRSGRCVRIYPKGDSMEPMLTGGRDSVLLAAPPSRLRRFDLPLYRRESGQFVLHRVVRVRGGCYDCCGDAQSVIEPGVRQEQILAVAVGFCRRGKNRSCSGVFYLLYCFVWQLSRRFRQRLLRLWRRLAFGRANLSERGQ